MMKHGAVAGLLLAAAGLAPGACSPAPTPAAVEAPSATVAQPAPASSPILVSGAWAAATPTGAKVAAGYLSIANASGAADRLVAASSPRAARVEIHAMSMDGEIMRMRKLDGLDVPAQGAVLLAPGGYHLMLIGIDAPLIEGETAPVTLTFAGAGVRDVTLPVRAREAGGHGGGHAGH